MRYTRQEGLVDCGICCLYNIIRYYKGNIDIEKLRKITNTNENGTSIYNLVKASNELGFKSKAYKCNINDLCSLTFPLIALIKLNNYNHFVIIENIDIDKIKVFDPIRGYLKLSFSEFLEEWQNIIITYELKDKIIKEKSIYNNYLIELLNNNKERATILIILSILSSIFGLIVSLIIKKIFDNNVKINNFIFFLFIILLKCLIDFIKNNYSIRLNNKIDYSLSSKVYEKLFSLPLKYHHLRPVGDKTSKITDLYIIRDFIFLVTSSSILDSMCIIIILFIFLFLKIRLFIITIIFSLLYIFLNYYFKNEEISLFTDLKEKEVNVNSNTIENLIGIDTIKNLDVDNKIIEKQKNQKIIYQKSFNKYSFFISLQMLFSDLLEQYGILILLFVGIFLVNDNKISLGELTMIYTLFILYFNSLKNMLSLYKTYNNSKLSYKRINNLLNVEYKKDGYKVIKDVDTIIFNNISYSYDNNKILSKFNLRINKGEYMLINGDSGKGKSTIFKLLNKDLDLDGGNIFINNIDIKDLKNNSIKNNICYVSQNEYIFTDSIKNNILMYKNIKSKELEKVLKVTLLDKTLKKKNINLDYILEENGSNLSGGERQKILIARSLLRGTNVIVFDETMNEIDTKSERKIIENIKTEYKKTIVLISHRSDNYDLFNKRVEV